MKKAHIEFKSEKTNEYADALYHFKNNGKPHAIDAIHLPDLLATGVFKEVKEGDKPVVAKKEARAAVTPKSKDNPRPATKAEMAAPLSEPQIPPAAEPKKPTPKAEDGTV